MDAFKEKTPNPQGCQAKENGVNQSYKNDTVLGEKNKFYFDNAVLIDAFKRTIVKAGMTPPDHITPGQMNRFSGTGQKDKTAWAVFFPNPDGTAGGCFGDWKTDFSETWFSNGNQTLSADQQRQMTRMLKETREKFEAERKAKHRAAAIKAQKLWDRAAPAPPDHPYLSKKGIEPHGVRCQGKTLIIPVMDAGGAICSLQWIPPDAGKKNFPGGKMKGGRFVIGAPTGADRLYIAEGFATGASIHEATGQPVIVAFSSNNLETVARHISKLYPDCRIIIAGDDDRFKKVNPGRKAAEAAARAIGAGFVLPTFEEPTKGTDFNDLHQSEGLEAVNKQLSEVRLPKTDDVQSAWQIAKQLFTKTAFPWEVFTPHISDSIKQLARSCATSSSSLPGAVMAIFSSVLGSTVSVSPKRSWKEPLIFWFADIRDSGDGKTHAARALLNPLYTAQSEADKDYERRMQEWQAEDKKERGPEPKRARGYYMSDLTLEGIREDLSGHGGTVCVLDELSSLLNAQNQYKSKGTDREAWLSLHDGKSTRIVRASKSKTITGARLNLFGGIQPEVWRKVFGGDNGLYLVDGTVYRLLPTYECSKFYPLTREPWDEKNQAIWENTLCRAMSWADNKMSHEKWTSTILMLDSEAGQLFIDWRNDLFAQKDELPKPIRGFIPKITGAALRLAGVLYCMRRFRLNCEPGQFLTVEDMQRGINSALFYMGHIVDALHLMVDENHITDDEVTDQVLQLAKTLECLKPELDSGRLAVGYIWERFNENCKPELKLSTAKAAGALLRSCQLTLPASRYRANGKTGVRCLVWDKKTEILIEQVHNVHQVHKPIDNKPSDVVDLKNQNPPSPQNLTKESEGVDMVDIEKQSPPALNPCKQDVCGHGGHGGHNFSVNKKTGRVTGVI